MLASITRLSPRIGTLEAALSDFRAARLSDCLGELHGLNETGAHVLAGRAHLRLGRPEAALRALGEARTRSSREHAEVALLGAAAHTRLGNTRGAAMSFSVARSHGIATGDVAVLAEIEFYLALFASAGNHAAEARAAAERGLRLAEDGTAREDGVMPRAHVIARLQELLGVLDGAAGRYGDFLGRARETLATLDASGVPDVYLESFALRNLAILARDFDLADAGAICERAGAIGWTRDIAAAQFTTLEATGWCYALRGDEASALRRFREAAAAASTTPEHVFVAVDRAMLAREAGYTTMAAEELDYALDLAANYAWPEAAGDYRVALLWLAQAAAATAPQRARTTLDRYFSIANAMDPAYAGRSEARVRAEEAFALGLVLRAEGRLGASAERLQTAFSLWNGIGHAWRAARAALELTELDAGETFRIAVRRELKVRPQSVFSNRARLVA